MSLVTASRRPGSTTLDDRPIVRGKFIYCGDRKWYMRGVTYGSFRPNADSEQFPSPAVVTEDFRRMAENGINAVRTYTVPPRWLLQSAFEQGLRVIVGLPWEQHITFLDDGYESAIERTVRDGVRACSGHPAVLCYSIGNEIPASIVRWTGRRRVERFLRRLYDIAKAEDPQGLVTYVNFPTTEYLHLPFLDLVTFNVYLENQERLEAYIARLQNISGDRPLIMAEIGLDSLRNGEDAQAEVLEWQIRSVFAAGCAGAFVFSWTDEWHRGGFDIDDWDFGLTTRDRRAKPALASVACAFSEAPFRENLKWPRVSVVVCSYNGARTIRQCLDHIDVLDYPNYEVIVVDDGSTDDTAKIAGRPNIRLISIPNGGLSHARNVGLEAAEGEIVAYIDDDAYPDPHWLKYLAYTFMTTDHAGVGGPNIPPSGDGPIADCVANAPGGPIHVLISDVEAEHIPGCNMAFRRDALMAAGGFDIQFRTAGDDVDACWRLQNCGGTLGFNPSAVVWHHRRNSLRAYLKQQIGYGRAEALLERKWPEKYNALGHLSWAGRLYGRGLAYPVVRRSLIYQGRWGSAPFQSIYERRLGALNELPQTPEWYLLSFVLLMLSLISIVLPEFRMFAPVLLIAVIPLLAQAISGAAHADFGGAVRPPLKRASLRILTMLLYLVQPLARLWGRMAHGLTPWRRRGVPEISFPWPRLVAVWSERWHSGNHYLETLEGMLQKRGVIVRGGDFDSWDLELRGGVLGAVRTRMVIEEHGGGKQFVKFRFWPTVSVNAFGSILLLVVITGYMGVSREAVGTFIVGSFAALLTFRMFNECAVAKASILNALQELREKL